MNAGAPTMDATERGDAQLRKWVVVAILGSLLLHVALWFWFLHVYLPGVAIPTPEKMVLRKFNLERVQINPKWSEPRLAAPTHVSPLPSPDRSTLAPAPETRTFTKMLSDAPSSPTLPAGSPVIPQDKPVPLSATPDTSQVDASMHSQLDRELNALREQQFQKTTKAAGAGRPILNQPGAPVAPRPGVTEMGLPSSPRQGPSQGLNVGEGAPTFMGSSQLEDFYGPGGLPPPPPLVTEKAKPVDVAGLVPQSLLKDKPVTKQKFESLNPFLNVELYTFERSGADGLSEGYFLVRVSAKPNQQIVVIPKDVSFVMDISSSIGGDRLEVFRKTVLEAIPKLNPDDRFRIMVFRDKLSFFGEGWIPAKGAPLDEVRSWLSTLDTGGVTDLYKGISPLTLTQRESGRMSLALVMSDGVPTTGLVDSTQIITDLSGENKGRTSIFSLSNGREVNNFLLDFLSYCNQGRLRYERDIPGSTGDFRELVQQVQKPLFLDPRFRFAGVDGEQVYPKSLPHLYQDSPLLLFGRYTPGQKEPISLQILGESLKSTCELVVQLPIPTTPNGPETLPATWARQRIYYLLGKMTQSKANRDAILDKVRTLSEQYKVEVPYF